MHAYSNKTHVCWVNAYPRYGNFITTYMGVQVSYAFREEDYSFIIHLEKGWFGAWTYACMGHWFFSQCNTWVNCPYTKGKMDN